VAPVFAAGFRVCGVTLGTCVTGGIGVKIRSVILFTP
jgi:hypothetical protein